MYDKLPSLSWSWTCAHFEYAVTTTVCSDVHLPCCVKMFLCHCLLPLGLTLVILLFHRDPWHLGECTEYMFPTVYLLEYMPFYGWTLWKHYMWSLGHVYTCVKSHSKFKETGKKSWLKKKELVKPTLSTLSLYEVKSMYLLLFWVGFKLFSFLIKISTPDIGSLHTPVTLTTENLRLPRVQRETVLKNE